MPAKKKAAADSKPAKRVQSTGPAIKLRTSQRVAFECRDRTLGIIARRQWGKSVFLGALGMSLMMKSVCDVVYVSAALRLGLENIRKEAAIWRQFMGYLRDLAGDAYRIDLGQAQDDKGQILDLDACCDLFEQQKLITKLYHSQTNFSRSLVVAPNPDTAVGWTGHLLMDEVGRMPEFKDLFEAVEPFISSNPEFILRLATTPPPDDAHYSYELLAPMVDDFEANVKGNFYRSEANIKVLRVDAWDAWLDGIPAGYDNDKRPLSPEQARQLASDKTAWDRNYGCKFIRGGTSAIAMLHLLNAAAAGESEGLAVDVTEQLDLEVA